MKRNLIIYGLIAVIVAGAAGYAWRAWDTGLIPGNPRAPTKENFEKFVDEALKDAAPEPTLCQDLGIHTVRGEEDYSNGARNNPSQGIFGVTLVPEIGGEERLRNIEMFRALAKSGYYTEADAKFVDESGTERAAKRYQMTLPGWYNTGPMQCLQLGQRAFNGITKTAKLETIDGTTAYEIVYEMKVPQLPAWAKVDNAEAIFRQLKTLSGAVERKAKLVRTNSGWEVRFAKAQAPGGGESASAPAQYVDSASGPKARRPPTLEEASKAFAAGIYNMASANLACLMLPANQYAADEIGDVSNVDRGKPYYATYYDDPARNPASQKQRADGLGLMRALQSLGMVDEEIASDMAINGQRYAGGAVFKLKQKYKVLLDPRTPGCLPIARLTPEVKAMRVTNVATSSAGESSYTVEVVGVARATNVQPWVAETGADKKLQFVKWILEEGLPLSGSMRHGAKDGLTNMQGYVARPIYATTEKPASLFAGLTRFYPPGRANTPAASPGGNEAHAIVVYEGKNNRWVPGASQEGLIMVSVGKTAAPVELFLSSYEPVLWRLTLEPGARVKRIVAIGYYPQRVVGAPAGVSVEGSNPALTNGKLSRLNYNDTRAIASGLRAMTNASVKSVQTMYTGVQFTVGQTLHPVPQSATGFRNLIR